MKDLIEALRQESGKLNLFSSGDREKLEIKHIPDSLAVLEFWKPLPEDKVADIGTGGGLPGLALAKECPEVYFTLIDSREKKIQAVKNIAENVGLENVEVIAGRLEDLAHEKKYREQFDAVTARALAPLPTLLEYAAGFIKEGGQLFAWKGSEFLDELKASEAAQEALDLHFEEAYEYTLPEGEARTILVFLKTAQIHGKYPRRAPLPKEKPL